MIYSGLVSVTFRQLPPEEIVALAVKAGIHGIEWGGDVHVPPSDAARAVEVARMTEEAGLMVAAYGSYYRICDHSRDAGPFEKVLETAVTLKTPTIRVWAGTRGSRDADAAWWRRVVDESRRIATMAQKEGITISYEYHGGTLTDTREAALLLVTEVNHTNIRSYWQPPVDQSHNERLLGLKEIKPWLNHLHVFCWKGHERYPLSEGREEWMKYFKEADAATEDRYALLEFVKDDAPEQFLEDAKTLRAMLKEYIK